VATPHQYGVARNLIREINEPQLLSYVETLRYHGKAAFCADIDRVTLRALVLARISPLDRHSYP